MALLRAGQSIRPPSLEGTWSAWSGSADAPGAYFLVPVDDTARSLGITYAVIKAIQRRDATHPEFELIRTSPHRPDLVPNKKRKHR